MQTDCPYLVQKIIKNTAIRIEKKIAQIKQIQAWHKTSSKISGCMKLKTNYQLSLLGIVM